MHRTAAPPRRSVLRGALGAAAAAPLAGCGAGSTSTAPDTLQVWGGVPPESGPAAVIDGFRRAHPGTRVAYTRYVNDERGNLKLDTALQGGVDVDVYFTYGQDSLALRSQSGMVADLTALVRGDRELSPYLNRREPRALWRGSRIIALATAREPWFVLANEELLRRARVELPHRWTTAGYEDTARRLSRRGPGGRRTYGAYTVPDLARIALGPNYWYTRGGNANFDDPAFLTNLATGRRMIDAGTAYPWTEVLARKMDAYQQNVFLAEEFALWPTAPFNLRFLNDAHNFPHRFRTAAAPLPDVPGGGGWNTGSFDNHIMVNPRTRHPELAREFVRFWCTRGAPAMLRAGKIPALTGRVTEEQIIAGLLGPHPERWFDVASFRRVLFDDRPRLSTDTELLAVPEITLMSGQQRDLCWIGEKSPHDALAALQAQAQAAIARNRRAAAQGGA